jgi:hypothetical protein
MALPLARAAGIAILALFIAVPDVGVGQPVDGGEKKCESEIDRFTGEKKIECKGWRIAADGSSVPETVHGAALSAIPAAEEDTFEIAASIRVHASDPVFIDAEKAYFLIDGERAEVQANRMEGKRTEGGVTGTVGFLLLPELADQVAAATSVKARVKDIVFDVSALSNQIQEIEKLKRKANGQETENRK